MKIIYAEAQPGKVVLNEKEIPAPGKGEVLLKAKYSAMSPGTENGLLGEHIVPLPTSMDMLLQPVVENAIKHGLWEKSGEGTVVIRVSRNEDILEIVVMDAKTYEIGEKVGYNNVRRFVDAFKQIYSMSPMEYRKTFREDKA